MADNQTLLSQKQHLADLPLLQKKKKKTFTAEKKKLSQVFTLVSNEDAMHFLNTDALCMLHKYVLTCSHVIRNSRLNGEESVIFSHVNAC